MNKGGNEIESLYKELEYKSFKLEESKLIYGSESKQCKRLKIEVTSLENQISFYKEMGWLNE